MIEHLKRDPDDFGGFQTKILAIEEAGQRLCAKRFCGDTGRVQISIPSEKGKVFRVICARHAVMLAIIQAAVLGDPSPLSEGARIAEKLGVDMSSIPNTKVPEVVDFAVAICDRCGDGLDIETVGLFKGRRFVHTCVKNS